MTLDEVTEKIKGRMARAGHIKARVKFDFGDEGLIFIDSTQDPPMVGHEDAEADCTLRCSMDTFNGFLEGTKDPNIAFMTGQLKVRGSMGLALKLNSILED